MQSYDHLLISNSEASGQANVQESVSLVPYPGGEPSIPGNTLIRGLELANASIDQDGSGTYLRLIINGISYKLVLLQDS
jgi:hypothetical protein